MSNTENVPYQVLARKYRSQNFDELIGQDALVRTLKNAIESGRIAHAFMLTGVRGVGKTSTARIIAKALNYAGPDGKSGPTTGATDDCPICQAISQDRHPDVIEMDAASRTGIDDIREILEGVKFATNEARFKIYIIDEVHMLSKQAFNALLKTLEEPPAHVKFIFATTEIRKVPVTVLSRCQRFDLRRVDVETLKNHFTKICGLENVEIEEEALDIIAKAADGSVRDGLSLLDQAIAHGQGKVDAEQVKSMIGLSDATRIMDLLEKSMEGQCEEALNIMQDLHNSGSDPLIIIQDLLDRVHLLTRCRAMKGKGENLGRTREENERIETLAAKLSMPSLGRAWQILLKGVQEINTAPNPYKAAEMIIIRLIYAADLPDPAKIVKSLQNGSMASTQAQAQNASAGQQSSVSENVHAEKTQPLLRAVAGGGAVADPAYEEEQEAQDSSQDSPEDFRGLVKFLEGHGEIVLAGQLYHQAHPVKFERGRIEFFQTPQAPQNMAQNLGKILREATGERWVVSVSSQGGSPTLAQEDAKEKALQLEKLMQQPEIKEVLEIFPGTEIRIKEKEE